MKVPLSWLENYVQLPPLDELLPRLTEIGHMLDGFIRLPNDQCITSAQSRLARIGESLPMLNGETVLLSESDLIIADRTGPLSLAGILGGDASKVISTSSDIIVEAGNFRPELVRRTARRHGLMTE